MSENGGVNWFEINTEFSDLLHSVYFTDPLNGWACGTDGNILRTIDGGYTWFQQYSGAQRYFTAVCFADPLTGWVAGEGGMIKKTTNGGFWNEPGVFHNKWLNKPILDNTDTKDTITVAVLQFKESLYDLTGLELMLDSVMHTRVSDLEISLAHGNVTATFVSQVAAPGANILWMRLKDDATRQIADGAAPYSGDYRPQTPLSAFNGMDPDGDWILTIHDGGGGNTGMLKAWGIRPLFERPVGIDEPRPEQEAGKITLLQNIPNPFSGTSRIIWSSEQAGQTILKIYDNQGRELETLVDEFKSKGGYSVEFDGSRYSPGVYYYRLQIEEIVLVKKCIIF
jgi:subtilisin-like proprotein convertase family protein